MALSAALDLEVLGYTVYSKVMILFLYINIIVVCIHPGTDCCAPISTVFKSPTYVEVRTALPLELDTSG
jgi:hypothetical protein